MRGVFVIDIYCLKCLTGILYRYRVLGKVRCRGERRGGRRGCYIFEVLVSILVGSSDFNFGFEVY